MKKLIAALRSETHTIQASLEKSGLFDHKGMIGDIREKIIDQVLRPYLPDCYSIGSGQIFDLKDAMSNQIDVVLYDQLFSTVLFKGENTQLFPYESVYGTIEVKSTLSSNELDVALDNAASVRRLTRAASHSSYLLPHWGSMISEKEGNAIKFDKRAANPPLNIIFAYDGLVADTCCKKLNAKVAAMSLEERRLVPDFVFNVKRQYVVMKGLTKPDGLWIASREFRGNEDFDTYFSVDLGDDTLAFFYITLNTFLNKIRLRASEPGEYWNKLFKTHTSPKA